MFILYLETYKLLILFSVCVCVGGGGGQNIKIQLILCVCVGGGGVLAISIFGRGMFTDLFICFFSLSLFGRRCSLICLFMFLLSLSLGGGVH